MNKKKLINISLIIATLILSAIAIFTAFKLYQIGKEKERPAEVFQVAEDDVCELTFTLLPPPSGSPSPSTSASPAVSPSVGASPSPSASAGISPSPSSSPSPSVSPSPSLSPSSSPSAGVSPSPSTSPGVSASPSASPSPSISPSPAVSLSPSPSVAYSPSPSASAGVSPSVIPSPSSSAPTTYFACWEQCTSTSQCPSGMQCLEVSGVYRCVNPSCPTDSDCTCDYIAQASPPPETKLPSAGIISPTLLLSLGGLLLIILGIIL